jgi:CRISPR-associated protein Cas1
MVELMQRNVPVLHFSHGGWFHGIAVGMSHKNVELRIRQFRWAEDEERSLLIAARSYPGRLRTAGFS